MRGAPGGLTATTNHSDTCGHRHDLCGLVGMVTFADEVRTRLTELDRPRLARFAVACATRMEPVFTTFWRSTQEVTEVNDWDLSGRPD